MAIPPSWRIVDDSGGKPLCRRGGVQGAGRMLLSRLILPTAVSSLQKAEKGTKSDRNYLVTKLAKKEKKNEKEQKANLLLVATRSTLTLLNLLV